MSDVPDISVEVSPGSKAWTRNGVWEAGLLTVSDEAGMARISSVSKKLHRGMTSGFLVTPEDLDRFCQEWMAGRST